MCCVGVELLVGGDLVVRKDLCGQPRLGDPVDPDFLELSRTDDNRESSLLEGVLLDEGETDLRLTRADSVRVDDTAVTLQDSSRSFVAVSLKVRELHRDDLARLLDPDLVSVKLGESAQVDRLRIHESQRGEEELAQLLEERCS